MAIDDKICIVCGKHHKYCMNNIKYDKNETWRNLYCSENCMDIFNVYNDYNHKVIDKSAAKAKLEKLDLDIQLKDNIRTVVKEILYVEPKPQTQPKRTKSRKAKND